jgi:hypothetical protein
MNAKGLVELIVLNVGLDAKVLTTETFTIFVIMALVTTFITTPLLHLIYLRHRGKYASDHLPGEYRAVITVRNTQTAPSMVSIVGSLFSQHTQNLSIKTLLLQEISDRPSSYFFSSYYSMWQDAPLVKSDKKELQMQIKQNPTLSSVRVSSRVLSTSNIADDVSNYAQERSYNILVLSIDHKPVSSAEAEETESFSLTRSFSKGIVGKQIKSSLSTLIPNSDVVENLIRKNKSSVGIFVRKIPQSKTQTESIVFLYGGFHYESYALEIVKSLVEQKFSSPATTIKNITIITTQEAQLPFESKESKPAVTIVRTSKLFFDDEIFSLFSSFFTFIGDPFDRSNVQENSYDLAIVGANRNESEIYSTFAVRNSSIPVFIVYPTKSAISQGSTLEEILIDETPRSSNSGSSSEKKP